MRDFWASAPILGVSMVLAAFFWAITPGIRGCADAQRTNAQAELKRAQAELIRAKADSIRLESYGGKPLPKSRTRE